MKFLRVSFIAVIMSLAACGSGGGSGGTTSSITPVTSTAASSTPPLAVFPNEHGLYPDANQVVQTDAEAGIFPNENGFARSYSTVGAIDTNGPFFKSFGNGRTCASCHKQEDGFSIKAKSLQKLFVDTEGTDPVFQLLDGANSPNASVGTLEERSAAYSMLLSKGLFRVGLKMPLSSEFLLVGVDDPYHFASADELSLFRRPLPSANLKFVTDVMWDGRETLEDNSSTICSRNGCFAPVDADLARQANNATKGHAQAQSDLSISDQNEIVAFEKTLFVAQQVGQTAGILFAADGTGGALALSTEDFSFALNDIFKTTFTPFNFSLFNDWIADASASDQKVIDARESITRGQVLFNSRQINIVSVVPGTESLNFSFLTCTTCHSTPNVGNLSEPHGFNIGTADAKTRTADMPLYSLQNKSTGEVVETQDPGLAMTSGLWQDIGRFKAPILRGLSTRAPYFHNGSANTIDDVVAFYNKQFNIQFTDQEKADLTAFLKSL